MSDRLFDIEEYPEVPVLPVPRARRAAGTTASDGRFLNDYPPEWGRCTTCGGRGTRVETRVTPPTTVDTGERCPDCLGMGSVKARVRLEAGHRCERCRHPYVPRGDAAMLGVRPSGMHPCEHEGCQDGELVGERFGVTVAGPCPACKGEGEVWSGWSACDERCDHAGPFRVRYGRPANPDTWVENVLPDTVDRVPVLARFDNALEVEAAWRVLTVHHLSGDKSDCRWGNLAALCQRCHLEVQAKIVLERVWPYEHSEWFRPHAAWWYAWSYLGEDLSREEVEARMDELLALERVA